MHLVTANFYIVDSFRNEGHGTLGRLSSLQPLITALITIIENIFSPHLYKIMKIKDGLRFQAKISFVSSESVILTIGTSLTRSLNINRIIENNFDL